MASDRVRTLPALNLRHMLAAFLSGIVGIVDFRLLWPIVILLINGLITVIYPLNPPAVKRYGACGGGKAVGSGGEWLIIGAREGQTTGASGPVGAWTALDKGQGDNKAGCRSRAGGGRVVHVNAELGGIDVCKGAEGGRSDVKLDAGQVDGMVRGGESDDIVAGNAHPGPQRTVATL